MSKEMRVLLSLGLFAALLAAALFLAQHGVYGWTLFIILPVIAGGLGTWSVRPATVGHAARIGATVGAVGCGLFLLLGVEGWICVLMAIPVVVPLAVAGSLLAYGGSHLAKSKRRRQWACSCRSACSSITT